MTITATQGHEDSHGPVGFVGSVLEGLTGIVTMLAATRERRMLHRVDFLLEDLDRETLIALGHERPVRRRVPVGRFPV